MEEKMVAVANEPLKAERNYGIDLLRIVSIFMVLMLHVLMQGGLLYAVDQFTFKGEVVWFLETACYCAVNVYAIISGYVGYKSKPRLKKLLTLWLEVFLYSALFGVVTSLYKFYAYGTPIDVTFLIKCCLPFITNQYWYFSAYVILFALMPMLNVAIEKTATPILRNGLIFVLFAFGFIPNATFMVGGGYSVIWLVVLYLLGGYLAKDKPFEKMPSWLCFVLYFVSVVINYASRWVAKWVGVEVDILISYQSIFIVLAAVFLVLGFARLRIGKAASKGIALLSPMAFGVYIIHTSSFFWDILLNGLMRQFLQQNVLIIVLISIGVALLLYAICSLIDFLRIKLFKLLKVESFFDWLLKLPGKVLGKIKSKKQEVKEAQETPSSDEEEKN